MPSSQQKEVAAVNKRDRWKMLDTSSQYGILLHISRLVTII
jgi:hypothetical protein